MLLKNNKWLTWFEASALCFWLLLKIYTMEFWCAWHLDLFQTLRCMPYNYSHRAECGNYQEGRKLHPLCIFYIWETCMFSLLTLVATLWKIYYYPSFTNLGHRSKMPKVTSLSPGGVRIVILDLSVSKVHIFSISKWSWSKNAILFNKIF